MFKEARLKSPEVLMKAYSRATLSTQGSYWLAYVVLVLGGVVFYVSFLEARLKTLEALTAA